MIRTSPMRLQKSLRWSQVVMVVDVVVLVVTNLQRMEEK